MIIGRRAKFVGALLAVGITLGTQNSVFAASTPVVSNLNDLTKVLDNTIINRNSSVTVDYKTKIANFSSVGKAINDAPKALDDYSFYNYAGYSYNLWYNGSDELITINYKFWESKDQKDYVDSQVKKILSTIITPNMTDEQKEKAIHDYIVTHVKYDYSFKNVSAYDALMYGKAVCQGYALLAYKMFTMAGLNARIVDGIANNGPHAWNMVKVDGNWYHIDITWDSCLSHNGAIAYNYFNLTDTQISKDHKINPSSTSPYPKANTVYKPNLAKWSTNIK
jgi:hypothetical protein